MTAWTEIFEGLDRDTLVRVAYEYMLSGMLFTRAMLPQVVLAGRSLDYLDEVAIDEWMGASPIYTARTRRLMGIEGDNVEAIMKALQLDVGFVHEYMDVAYRLIDDLHGEFWLQHCGALLDAEPHGEERVFGMCHTIEDPTFDATAFATNPRARIRPIHRPPRTPADRHPHCHWTIEIDPDGDPVGPARLTAAVGSLALAGVANPAPAPTGDGMVDYRGPLRPDFRLWHLDSSTLAAVAREFQMQSHLLACAFHLAVQDPFPDTSDDMAAQIWVGSGWVISERLAGLLSGGAGRGAGAGAASQLAAVLALHPSLVPGLDREIQVDGDRVIMTVRNTVPGLWDKEHPGLTGVLARGDKRGLEAMVHAVVRTATVELALDDAKESATVTIDTAAEAEPAPLPDMAALTQLGLPATWKFSVS
jgi:hypothetical protein